MGEVSPIRYVCVPDYNGSEYSYVRHLANYIVATREAMQTYIRGVPFFVMEITVIWIL